MSDAKPPPERAFRTTLNEVEPNIPGIPLDDLKRRLKEGAVAADLLTDSGLLFELNRKVLHPLGLALGYQREDDGSAATFFVLDRREHPEGIVFASDTFTRAQARLSAYMEARGNAALIARYASLGFAWQTRAEPPQPTPTPGADAVTDPTDPMLQFFGYTHLPLAMQEVSRPFCELAKQMVLTLPSNPERSAALRKLLEAKDCAVRAAIYKQPAQTWQPNTHYPAGTVVAPASAPAEAPKEPSPE
jgi:hypothetical protein